MPGRIILPGEVGSQIEPRLTLEGLRDMIRGIRERGERIPNYIVVSEYDRRDLNQDTLGASAQEVARDDQRPEHDREAIAIVEGVMVLSHPDVPRNKARLVYPPVVEKEKPLPSGKLISVGGPAPAGFKRINSFFPKAS